MNCLLLNDRGSDLGKVLESCGGKLTRMTFEEALHAELDGYDSFCIFGECGVLDPRLRDKLEAQCFQKGKRTFAEALLSFADVYCAGPADTTRSRLVALLPEEEGGVPGLAVGDLLDDGGNRMVKPWFAVPGMRVLLAYREHIVAHRRWNAPPEEMQKDSAPGLWLLGDNVMMTSFTLHNFIRARYAPSQTWKRLIAFIAGWLTGGTPSRWPEPVVRYGVTEDLSDDATFDRCRRAAVERGVRWLRGYLADEGRGGVREGLRHNIDPEGVQATADSIRTDCTGEAAGAFRFYGCLSGSKEAHAIADNLTGLVFGPMMRKGGPFDGMLRWTDTGWEVCYQDDAARAVLPALYDCYYLGNRKRFPDVCRALDFLVRTTARDGCRQPRTDAPFLDEKGLRELAEAAHGAPSAHYNAYYHAALLLAYLCGGSEAYLHTARRGLETIMELYPDTRREQSETEELCRLILPLALLYQATGEATHRDLLYRVAEDLEAHRHPFGGYCEWDTGYQASCSRDSNGECSLLTENGDPVADLLYSVNWLPVGFATAWRVTGDRRFYDRWRGIAAFFLKTQVLSDDPKTDGSWCRAFDMDLREAYGNPHDVGWAALCSESGWTDAEILMGLMLPEIFGKTVANG